MYQGRDLCKSSSIVLVTAQQQLIFDDATGCRVIERNPAGVPTRVTHLTTTPDHSSSVRKYQVSVIHCAGAIISFLITQSVDGSLAATAYAWAVTLAGALATVGGSTLLVWMDLLDNRLSRKIMHIGEQQAAH